MTDTTPATLEAYWQAQGYSPAEARRIAADQIADAVAEAEMAELHDAGLWNLEP